MAYTTINNGSLFMNPKIYTGNGSTNNITGVGFQPDWVWTKCRSTVNSSRLIDAVRGVTKAIVSNSTGAEFTEANGLSAFGTDGYTLNGNLASMNTNSDTYVSWNWKANGAGSANTDGSISSTVSANTTSGFSIVSYTGTGANATVGHGLGVAPKMVILKSRANAYNWGVYHASIGATKYLRLNSTNAEATSSAYFQDTAPTSTFITLGSDLNINDSGNMIAYCFAEKQGYSKFGSYTGNGNADGTFIYTGFKPAFAMFKDTTSARDWTMLDNKRNTFNVVDKRLFPNNSDAENDTDILDFTSQGIKLRSTNTSVNVSGNTYIYMAFAENPITSSTGVPSTAR